MGTATSNVGYPDFEAYPASFKRGTYFRRVNVERLLTDAERERIPEKHRPQPDQLVTRSEVQALDMPPFVAVANRAAVVFDGAEPEIRLAA